MTMELKDCVALVTGGNRGIGEAFVRGFLAAGAAKVYVGTRDVANAAHLVAEGAGKIVAVQLDISDPAQIEAAAARCQDVSVLVNNAGQFSMQTLMTAPDLRLTRHHLADLERVTG